MAEQVPEQVSYPFTDPITGRLCHLAFYGPTPSWWDHTAGVAHPGCQMLADVSPDLDAFYCPACGHNGRISGAWAVDMLRAVGAPPSDTTPTGAPAEPTNDAIGADGAAP